MSHTLLQNSPWSPVERAVRERFQEGGSIVGVLLVALTIAGVVAITYWLTLRSERANRPSPAVSDPQGLFSDCLEGSPLARPQRQLLLSVANDLRLAHPSVMLISEATFDECVVRWRDEGEKPLPAAGDDAIVTATRAALFPG